MAEPTQFAFNLSELATLLIRNQGIHEGRWMVAFEFGFAAANAGSSPSEIKPAAIVQITKAMLTRAPDAIPNESGLVVDASLVNPIQGTKESPASLKSHRTVKARSAKAR